MSERNLRIAVFALGEFHVLIERLMARWDRAERERIENVLYCDVCHAFLARQPERFAAFRASAMLNHKLAPIARCVDTNRY